MSTTVVPSGTYGSGGGGTALTIAESRLHGIRVDWKDVATITIQPGRQLADDDTAITVATGFDVTFADIDTGAEASSTGYYVWLTGASSAVLSLSATAPTGVTGAKYLAGFIYNNSGSDIEPFRTEVLGDTLDVYFDDTAGTHWPVNVTHTIATTFQSVSGLAYIPAEAMGMHLVGYCWTGTMIISRDGVASHWSLSSGAHSVSLQIYTASGATFYWKKTASVAGDALDIFVAGYRFDRSGLTYA